MLVFAFLHDVKLKFFFVLAAHVMLYCKLTVSAEVLERQDGKVSETLPQQNGTSKESEDVHLDLNERRDPPVPTARTSERSQSATPKLVCKGI